ncbi:MAG TPA: hypothetical protein VMI54_01570 [Polyangiaceae bacterium]|nr:hypothetical protein [Polyangiaceae bacterium]
MARSSHSRSWMLGLVSLLTTGCLVPDAPEYGVANRTPIFVDPNSISPNPRSVQHYDDVEGAAPLDFHFLIHSEDAGDDLVTAFYIDYNGRGSYKDHKSIKASTLDVARLVQWHWDMPAGFLTTDPGCHVITITVLHETGWDGQNNQQIGSPPDLAAVSWFATFNDDQGVIPLSACPDPSTDSKGTTQ